MSTGPRRTDTGGRPTSVLGRLLTDAGISAISAFLGVMVVYLVLLALFCVQLFDILTGGAAVASTTASATPVWSVYGFVGLLLALSWGFFLGVFLTFFFATFVFVGLHGGEVEFAISATGTVDPLVALLPVSPTVTGSGTVPITAETLAVPFAELGLALPPLVLFWYGTAVGAGTRSLPDLLTKPVTLVLGYGLAAAVATLAATWLFNLVVADLFVALLSALPVVQSAELSVVLPDFPQTALRMCVGYPLVFGGAGALVGLVVDRVRGEQAEGVA